jgi:hypothetical protein
VSCLFALMEKIVEATLPAASELDREVELWDWARCAGISAEELRQAVEALLSAADLRKAA